MVWCAGVCKYVYVCFIIFVCMFVFRVLVCGFYFIMLFFYLYKCKLSMRDCLLITTIESGSLVYNSVDGNIIGAAAVVNQPPTKVTLAERLVYNSLVPA